jgi:hypothetical protein
VRGSEEYTWATARRRASRWACRGAEAARSSDCKKLERELTRELFGSMPRLEATIECWIPGRSYESKRSTSSAFLPETFRALRRHSCFSASTFSRISSCFRSSRAVCTSADPVDALPRAPLPHTPPLLLRSVGVRAAEIAIAYEALSCLLMPLSYQSTHLHHILCPSSVNLDSAVRLSGYRSAWKGQ